jgi:hypothetical protein
MTRRVSGALGQPRDLAQMRQRLDEWRSSHARGWHFPRRCGWRRATGAAARGVLDGARIGPGIQQSQTGEWPGYRPGSRRGEAAADGEPMEFIELTGALAASASDCRLSLRNVDGQRLQHRDGAERGDRDGVAVMPVGLDCGTVIQLTAQMRTPGSGGERRLSRRHRWVGADLPGAT